MLPLCYHMVTVVHGNLTVADVAVIVGYILGVIVVGTWAARQVSVSLILSRAAF